MKNGDGYLNDSLMQPIDLSPLTEMVGNLFGRLNFQMITASTASMPNLNSKNSCCWCKAAGLLDGIVVADVQFDAFGNTNTAHLGFSVFEHDIFSGVREI